MKRRWIVVFLLSCMGKSQAQNPYDYVSIIHDFVINVYVDHILQGSQYINTPPTLYALPGAIDSCAGYKGPYKNLTQKFDTVAIQRNLYVVTPDAREGYLEVNKGLTSYIDQNQLNRNQIQTIYMVNDRRVATCQDVHRLKTLEPDEILHTEYSCDTVGPDSSLYIRIYTVDKEQQ